MKEPMISVEEALARVLAAAAPVDAEEVALARRFRPHAGRAGRRRPHAAAVRQFRDGRLRAARAPTPPRRARDCASSANRRRAALSRASSAPARRCASSPARRCPHGADAVAMQEDAQREGDVRRRCEAPRRAGDNVRGVGHRFSRRRRAAAGGPPADAARRRADRGGQPADACACAASRASRSSPPATNCARRARRWGRRRSSPPTTSSSPASRRRRARRRSTSASPPTGPEALAERIAAAQAARADVLVTLGGASVGDYDLVQKALTDAGMELGFWRIAMRPGKPLMFGTLGAMLALGLPGNPTSSAVCGLLFLRAAAAGASGRSRSRRRRERAGAARRRSARQRRAPGLYARDARARRDGGWIATPSRDQDSSLVRTLAQAEALIMRAPHAPPARAGETCRILRFAGSAARRFADQRAAEKRRGRRARGASGFRVGRERTSPPRP